MKMLINAHNQRSESAIITCLGWEKDSLFLLQYNSNIWKNEKLVKRGNS